MVPPSDAPVKDAIVEKLKKRASEDRAFNAMCHAFALRERTRQQVTVRNLNLSMMKEGYNFSSAEYAEGLKFLAVCGLGKLEVEGKEVKALKNLSVTLQSIGKAALTTEEVADLTRSTPKKKFVPIDNVGSKLDIPPPLVDMDTPNGKKSAGHVTMHNTSPSEGMHRVALVIDDKSIDLGNKFTSADIGAILMKLIASKNSL